MLNVTVSVPWAPIHYFILNEILFSKKQIYNSILRLIIKTKFCWIILFFENSRHWCCFSGQLRSCQYGRRPRTMHGYPAKDVQIMFDRRPKTRCECQILIGNVEKLSIFLLLFLSQHIFLAQNLDQLLYIYVKWNVSIKSFKY